MLATPSEACTEYALNMGADDHNADRQWLLTGWDSWVRNPHYRGPAQRHPEDECLDDDE